MAIDDFVTSEITTESPGVEQAGFGKPLILAHNATFPERVRTYKRAADMLGDGFEDWHPEHLAAVRLTQQEPRPREFLLGRCASRPERSFTLSVPAGGVKAGATYSFLFLLLHEDGGGELAPSFVAGAGATNDTIIEGLFAALPEDFGAAELVGAEGAKQLKITAPSADASFAVIVAPSMAGLLRAADTSTVGAPGGPTVADDLRAIMAEDSSWYALIPTIGSKAYIAALADEIEQTSKMLFATSCDTEIIAEPKAAATDVAATLAGLKLKQAVVSYHPDALGFLSPAWCGKRLPAAPGSETWGFAQTTGLRTYALTATQKANLAAKNCNYLTEAGGKTFVTDGRVASGEWVDVVRFEDWLNARIAEAVFGLLVDALKVGFTDDGIALIQAQIQAVLAEGVRVGGLVDDPAPVVNVPRARDVPKADKQARRFDLATWDATLAGAIHSSRIRGVLRP